EVVVSALGSRTFADGGGWAWFGGAGTWKLGPTRCGLMAGRVWIEDDSAARRGDGWDWPGGRRRRWRAWCRGTLGPGWAGARRPGRHVRNLFGVLDDLADPVHRAL